MEFKLSITIDPVTKDCQVTGPINQRAACLDALNLARSVIEQYHRRPQKEAALARAGVAAPGAFLKNIIKGL